MDNMPTTNNNTTPQASIAGDGDDETDMDFCIQIKTLHLTCDGIVDLESNEVDKAVLCEEQNEMYEIELASLTSDILNDIIGKVIGQSGDHGGAETSPEYLSFRYVYDEEGRAAQSLEGLSDEELRNIIASDNGYVDVVWGWP